MQNTPHTTSMSDQNEKFQQFTQWSLTFFYSILSIYISALACFGRLNQMSSGFSENTDKKLPDKSLGAGWVFLYTFHVDFFFAFSHLKMMWKLESQIAFH